MSHRLLLSINGRLPQLLSSPINAAATRNTLLAASISTSAVNRVKEIVKTEDNGKLIIEGVTKSSDRASLVVKPPVQSHESTCVLCQLNLDVKHTDVLILSQFVRPDGCMLPKRVTGLCNMQQKRVTKLVAMAQKAGLMPNLTPAYSHKDPKKRYQWKKFNAYYDETTIKC